MCRFLNFLDSYQHCQPKFFSTSLSSYKKKFPAVCLALSSFFFCFAHKFRLKSCCLEAKTSKFNHFRCNKLTWKFSPAKEKLRSKTCRRKFASAQVIPRVMRLPPYLLFLRSFECFLPSTSSRKEKPGKSASNCKFVFYFRFRGDFFCFLLFLLSSSLSVTFAGWVEG